MGDSRRDEDRQKIFDFLNTCSGAEFEEVLLRLSIPTNYVRPPEAARTARVIDVMDHLASRGDGYERALQLVEQRCRRQANLKTYIDSEPTPKEVLRILILFESKGEEHVMRFSAKLRTSVVKTRISERHALPLAPYFESTEIRAESALFSRRQQRYLDDHLTLAENGVTDGEVLNFMYLATAACG